MDKYHIYEEIGKGEFSQVFKGREKKKIEYVAIKRIEKSVMNKIVNEVHVMHKLKGAHMLKFHDWYETRNNLWLILEYCTGADLEALIKQDGHLPETSVRIFGLDMLAALKYIHGEGMIHGDIRPINFLVDEYGILKLGDFKYTRKIPKEALGDSPVSERGTAPYMAPELFTSEGVHSFQSDFWALGCVLYQMRRGHLPFGDSTMKLSSLQHNIRYVEPVNAPLPIPTPEGTTINIKLTHPPVTADLADLLLWLLEKSPADRCSWDTICSHPFWAPNNPVPPTKLPNQPAFESYCSELTRTQSQALENSYIEEYGVRTDSSLEENGRDTYAPPTLGTGTTPLKLPQAADSSTIRNDNIIGVSGTRTGGTAISTAPGIAQRESVTSHLSTPPKGVAISNNHITPERNTSAAQLAAQALTSTQHKGTPSSVNLHDLNHNSRATGAIEAVASNPKSQNLLNNSDLPSAEESFLQPPSARSNTDKVAVPQAEQAADKSLSSVGDILSDFPVHSLLQHSSDTQVKSIAGNRQIEVLEKIGFKPESLSFAPHAIEDITQLSASALETHLSTVYKLLAKTLTAAQTSIPTIAASNALFDRLTLLGYLNSISSCAEVANVVLNTLFLNLILKIMKNTVVYSSSAPGSRAHGSAGSQATVTLVAAMNGNAMQSRVWAATALSIMLRYVSHLQPPSIRSRDEHIVPSIVAILRDSAKLDVKLKRRAVAALGETVFYISAQLEETGTERWNLPVQAVDALIDCLTEENDEVVKHYAAKTIENVFAQGAIEFRRRFVSLDLAVRLMELSQTSKNEHLQGSCGMAVAHMMHLLQTAHHHLPIPLAQSGVGGVSGNNLNTTGRVAISARGNNNALNATATLNDAFTNPSPVRGAKFLAKTLERGGLPGMIEVLRDGPQKLQQAYLNIINLVFCVPLPLPVDASVDADTVVIAPASVQAITVALRMSRNFFLKSPVVLPQLLNLMEQGGLSAIRGKALLAAQLIGATSPTLLASFAERRLPNLLVRALSPVFAAMENDPSKPPRAMTLNYYSKTAMSMLYFLRRSCLDATAGISEQLSLLIANPTALLLTDTSQHESPSKHTPNSKRNATLGSPRTMHATPAGKSGVDGTDSTSTHANSGTVSYTALQEHASVLSAIASTASQPALRRMILATDSHVVYAFGQALQLLPNARSALSTLFHSTQTATSTSRTTSNLDIVSILEGIEFAVRDAEHACLIMLEMLCQTDPTDSGAVMSHFLEAMVHSLIPSAALLLGHQNGNARVVVSSSLRRSVPAVLQLCMQMSASAKENSNLAAMGMACVPAIVMHSSALLMDQPPIPQYFMRLLVDLMSIAPPYSHVVVEELVKSGAVDILIKLLKPRPRQDALDDDREGETDNNPLLATLLRQIFETADFGGVLLRCELAPMLTEATIAAVYSSMNDSLSRGLYPRAQAENFSPLQLPSHEGVSRLAELTQVVLYQVMRMQPKDSTPTPSGNIAQLYRRQVATMRVLSPVVLTIISYASTFLRLNSVEPMSSPGPGTDESATCTPEMVAYAHLLDCASRCLALLFDLFPDSLTSQLLSKVSVLLDGSSSNNNNNKMNRNSDFKSHSNIPLMPRAVLADALLNPEIELKVRYRLLKVLHALCRVAASMNLGGHVQEFLSTPPLSVALQSCSSAADVATSVRAHYDKSMHVDEISTFVRTAAQLCELGQRL